MCLWLLLFCFVLLQTKIHFVALAGLEFTKIHIRVRQGNIFKINPREDRLRNTCQGRGDGLVGECLRGRQES